MQKENPQRRKQRRQFRPIKIVRPHSLSGCLARTYANNPNNEAQMILPVSGFLFRVDMPDHVVW